MHLGRWGKATCCPPVMLAGRLQAWVPGQINFSACRTPKDRLGCRCAGTRLDGPSVTQPPCSGERAPGRRHRSEKGTDEGGRGVGPALEARIPSLATPKEGFCAWLREDCSAWNLCGSSGWMGQVKPE